MKTITLICLASLFFSFSAHSQISKGAVLLGGNLNYSQNSFSNSPDDYKNHSYTINPSLGFVLKENKVWGINFQFYHFINQSATDVKQVSNDYQVGGFHRRYLPLGKSFYLYGQGQVNLGIGNQKNQSQTSKQEIRSKSVTASLFPGISYGVSKTFHLELAMANFLSMYYSTTKGQNVSDPNTKNSQFNFSVHASPVSDIALGFRILLGNK
jgi:hypothetical protein